NEPPLVYYDIPIIGHSFEFLNNSEELLRKAHQQHGDIFSIYTFGRIVTFITNKLSYEILSTKSMNFLVYLESRMPLARLVNLHNEDYATIFTELVRQGIVGRMEVFRDRIQKSLSLALDELIGDCKEPKFICKPLDLCQEIIARSVANIYMGEELCHDKEIIRTFKNFAADVSMCSRTPPFLS
ncbi:2242_t:CDS:2, partial [Ambispora leptoticha]